MAQRYTDETKAEVIEALRNSIMQGIDDAVTRVAEQYKLPYKTVWHWANREGLVGSQTREKKRIELDVLLEDKARMLLDSMTDDDKKLRDKAIAIGILLDKKIGLQAVLQGQGIGAADWLAHVTITRAREDSVDTQRPTEGESMAPSDATIPVPATVGEGDTPGGSTEGR